MKYYKLFYSFLFTILFAVKSFAENPPMPPPIDPNNPGGSGGSGTGSIASPIDMYVYVLGIVAILIIALYAKTIHKRQTV